MSYEAWGEPDGRPLRVVRSAARLPACMGGGCTVRETCARYHQAQRSDPVERLCMPGRRDMLQAVMPEVNK